MKKLSVIFILQLLFCTNLLAQQPHIIIIYTDDMGIGDMSCSGGEVEPTPNIDRLAQGGKRFTQYYTTAPVCSPSRVSVTTGMYHVKWNINTFLSSRRFNAKCEQSDFLVAEAPTIAKTLKTAGYKTAHYGKWHMGGGRDVKNAPSIAEYGFDDFASTWESPNPDPLLTSGNWIWTAEDSIKRWERTAYFVDKTLAFLDANKETPCFINLWPDDVHSPWVPDESSQENWKGTAFNLDKMQLVMGEFDKQIGRLLDGLEQKGLLENTLIIFTSDNGPAPSFDRIRTNGLRGVKNSLYEGGILMPFIVHWPKKVQAGQVDSASVIASIDLLPTLCKIANAQLPEHFQPDGEDISKSWLRKKSYEREQDLFFEYGRNEDFKYPKNGTDRSLHLAVRHGDWKLFATPDGKTVELYNLKSDPTESHNLVQEKQEIVKELLPKLLSWFASSDKAYVSGNNLMSK
ncbi:sulfatase-like hydrolase/transferase [Limibacter armeniacum]|uniref:sulfatase family protein n=1 Tax=Limibacter armeniacum TaxID=466084 RepID=UPI002FE6B714